MIKNCKYCEEEFETENNRKLYCNRSCASMATQTRRNAKKPKQICKWCNEEFQPKWDNQQCCTPECSSFYVQNKPEVAAKKSKTLRENGNLKGEKNPFYGKTHPKEIRNKISEGVISYMKEHGNAFEGKKHSDETKARMSEKAKIRTRTPEARDKMSKWNVERILENGGVTPGIKHHKHGKYYSAKNDYEIPYDSSYELQAYTILEQLDQVVSYSRCKFYIEYEIDRKTRRYIPDILVTYKDNTKQIIEIKPDSLVDDEVNVIKFASAKKYCEDNDMTFNVWTESKLFN